MATLFLHPTRQTYYYRVVIPRNLRQHFRGKIQFWRSLHTADKDEARLRSAQWEVRVQRVLLTLKGRGASMTSTEIEALVGRWMESSLEESEDYRAVCGPVSDDYREGVYIVLSDQFEEVDEALVSCDYRSVAKEAEGLLQSAGIKLDPIGKDFGRFCRRLLRAKQEVLRIEADRWEGIYPPTPVVAAVPSSAAPSPPVKASPPFSEVVTAYFKENTRATRTDSQVRAELDRFVDVLGGDEPIATITKEHTRAYKEEMLQGRRLSLATCIKHLSSLSGVFKWSEAQGHIPEGSNPVRGLSPNKRQAKKQATQRRLFSDAELLAVFGSKEFLAQREKHPARYWLPLLCLFEVCRREEAGQLSLADIGEEESVPYLRITDEGAGQGLKNAGSR